MTTKYDWRKYYNRRKEKLKALKAKELKEKDSLAVASTASTQTDVVSKVKQEVLTPPKDLIRVHEVTMTISTAIAYADMIADNLISMRKAERYQSEKGRGYIRGLEEKIEHIRRAVRKIKEKNNS